jgi:hypothetical protein
LEGVEPKGHTEYALRRECRNAWQQLGGTCVPLTWLQGADDAQIVNLLLLSR